MAISSIFRLDAFTRGLLREVCKELFLLLTALRSGGRRLKHAHIQRFVEETVPLPRVTSKDVSEYAEEHLNNFPLF